MMYVFYCSQCKRISYHTKINELCRICSAKLYRLTIEFNDFVELDILEREKLISTIDEDMALVTPRNRDSQTKLPTREELLKPYKT